MAANMHGRRFRWCGNDRGLPHHWADQLQRYSKVWSSHARAIHGGVLLSAVSAMGLTAYILPSTRTKTLLHNVIVTDGSKQVAHRPLPYGAPISDGADHELRGLGYRRLDDCTPSGDWWRCTVEPLP